MRTTVKIEHKDLREDKNGKKIKTRNGKVYTNKEVKTISKIRTRGKNQYTENG